jgi:hypothetical protein
MILRRDLHGDGAQGNPHHLLDRNENQRQPGPADAGKLAKKKYHPALILLEHAERDQDIERYWYDKKGDPVHGFLIVSRGTPVRGASLQRLHGRVERSAARG